MTLELYFKIVLYVATALFGLCIGSFLNVVIYRVPLGMSVASPPSHCPNCDKRIRWYDNIPVLSYLCLRGKCRNCKEPISFRYTAVELGNMLLWLLCVWRFWEFSIPYAIITALTSSVLICVFFIDLEHMLIFDRFQIILAVLGVGAVVFESSPFAWETLIPHLIGAAAGFAVFFLIGTVISKIAKKEALGFGDVKLAAVMGLFLGWQKLLFSALIASLTASIVLLILRGSKQEENGKEYPFAPFLAAGFQLSMIFGDAVINWYMSLLT